jgi:hypothetical protein
MPLEIVITSSGESMGYPSHVWVYGYLRNLGKKPLRDVELELIETWFPYDPDVSPGAYQIPAHISPALTETLPGQINPFFHERSVGKSNVHFGPVYIVGGRYPARDEPRITALEAGAWEHEDRYLRGTVRNASAHTVSGVQVVGTTLGDCSWRMATPEQTRLLPGEETAFFADYFYSFCLDEGVVVLGQGIVEGE